ncbi:hypothetical protein SAMN05446037_100566 [Anaerovirgula multivorans]|uniref:Uncharacterized protein n=1 Tax=Anaerovirgula multivorans TaxID=312168 RepID=A0A239C8Z5_9FIRM|nr:hypothetical protein [Anaerovirgula multivorans]SNS16429.1 hypothetical protein SAMN05446037_100566 [Anaerovirgula multivorans]
MKAYSVFLTGMRRGLYHHCQNISTGNGVEEICKTSDAPQGKRCFFILQKPSKMRKVHEKNK